MTIHQKLDRLTKLATHSKVSRAAGMNDGYLRIVLLRRIDISVSSASKLAKALGVDVGWLMDDAQGWPPVRREGDENKNAPASNAA